MDTVAVEARATLVVEVSRLVVLASSFFKEMVFYWDLALAGRRVLVLT